MSDSIGKFPHLAVSASSSQGAKNAVGEGEVIVNFGHVAVETVAEKWLKLKNMSPVS